MPKVIPTRLSQKERDKLKKLLSFKIYKLSSSQEVTNFLEELLTESEMVMIYRRLQIAKMLLDGALYYEIKDKLAVSYATIKVVREKINRGKGGYIKFIKGLKA